jgi:exosome complex exonuclease RRP6
LLVQLLQSGKTVEKLSLNFISLEKITKLFLNVDLDKTFQVADWRIRPLPKGMLDYARNDSHYLIPIYMIVQEICLSSL